LAKRLFEMSHRQVGHWTRTCLALAWPLENCEMIGSVYCFPVQQSDLIVSILFRGAIYNEFAMRGDSCTFHDFDLKAIDSQLA
jgi:hypothetical protein